MAKITLKGTPFSTNGDVASPGSTLPDLTFANSDLESVKLSDFPGRKLLNIFPSVDTGVCAKSVRKFNEAASGLEGTTVLNISADLPFAHQRFCAAEGIKNAHTLSGFRSNAAEQLGLKIQDGPFAGLFARCVIIVDEDLKVLYAELVPEIATEPDYSSALDALR